MNVTVVTLIFFVLAVVVFIKLHNVLGQRTGNERPPFDPYAKPQNHTNEAENRAGSETNVVSLPVRAKKQGDYSEIDALAPAGSVLNDGLRRIVRADSGFTPAAFTSGVRSAYEIIMTAFAAGERDPLHQLLSPEIYADFAAAIEAREAEGRTVKFSFVGMDKIAITMAVLQEAEAQITLAITSEIISATYDRDGELVEGDPKALVILRDLWTFARDTRSSNPNWLLVATDEA